MTYLRGTLTLGLKGRFYTKLVLNLKGRFYADVSFVYLMGTFMSCTRMVITINFKTWSHSMYFYASALDYPPLVANL